MIVGDGLPVLFASLVGESLSADIYQVVLIVVVATVFVCYTGKENGCLSGIFGIIIVAHLRPAGYLEVVERRATAEDALVSTLLVVAHRTVVDALRQECPCLLDGCIVHTIAGIAVFLEPVFLGSLLGTPRQFAHQLKHHRVVFRTFHREAPTLERFTIMIAFSLFSCCQIEVVQQLVHSSMQSHIASEVLEHTEEPLMLAVTAIPLQNARTAKHRSAF